LVGNLLEVEALPRPLRRRILDHAEGNPFYVEEVIRSLIDSDVVVYDEMADQWQATRRIEDIAIPDSLQGVLMARIDRLQEEARRVLQLASVIGRIFLYRVLAAIAEEDREHPERSRRVLDASLLTLQREEMIRQRARVPELEYIFKHHLTQQAAYNGLLRRERRRFHGQVAEALGRLFPDRVEEQLGILGRHWEQAGEWERAVEYLRRAGEQAAAQFANEEAVGYFTRALELVPEEDLYGRYELLLARERVCDLEGDRGAQRRDLVSLEALGDALQDDRRRGEVALRDAWYAIQTSNHSAAVAAAEIAINLGRTVQDAKLEVMGHLHSSMAHMDLGHYEDARAHHERSLSLARSADLRQQEADSLYSLGFVYYHQGKYAEASASCEQALYIHRQLQFRWGEMRSLQVFGLVRFDQSYFDDAMVCWEQALGIAREMGDQHCEGAFLLSLGWLTIRLGDYGRAKTYCQQSLRILRQTGHRRNQGSAVGSLGLVIHYLGDDELAREYCQQAVRIGLDSADRFIQAWGLTWLGHVLVGLGTLDEATDAYRRALILRRELHEYHRAIDPLAGLASVSMSQGSMLQAQARVEEIMSCLQTSSLDGAWEPGRIYLTCYRVLQANGDARAQNMLEDGYCFVQERAAKISDEDDRRSYLQNVAANREIVEEWARVQGEG